MKTEPGFRWYFGRVHKLYGVVWLPYYCSLLCREQIENVRGQLQRRINLDQATRLSSPKEMNSIHGFSSQNLSFINDSNLWHQGYWKIIIWRLGFGGTEGSCSVNIVFSCFAKALSRIKCPSTMCRCIAGCIFVCTLMWAAHASRSSTLGCEPS